MSEPTYRDFTPADPEMLAALARIANGTSAARYMPPKRRTYGLRKPYTEAQIARVRPLSRSDFSVPYSETGISRMYQANIDYFNRAAKVCGAFAVLCVLVIAVIWIGVAVGWWHS